MEATRGKTKSWGRHHLIMPVNFSLIAFESTHMISAEAILAITFVTCQSNSFQESEIYELLLSK
jgi:hypothetical protein